MASISCLHAASRTQRKRGALPGTTCQTSGLTSAALPLHLGQGPAGVSEAQGFDLRRSREPWARGRLCALSRSQPPGGCLRGNPGHSGALRRQSAHVGDWPEAVAETFWVTLGDKGRSGDLHAPTPPPSSGGTQVRTVPHSSWGRWILPGLQPNLGKICRVSCTRERAGGSRSHPNLGRTSHKSMHMQPRTQAPLV